MASAATTLCLTLDLDWAIDEVVRDAFELVSSYGVKATWFVTHQTPMIEEIGQQSEIGLHPNFNPLLEGAGGDMRTVLSKTRQLAPEARVIRSHSLVRSSRLASLFAAEGFTHESNTLTPISAGPCLVPWRDFSGLIQVPIRWEDDVRLVDDTLGEPAELIGRTPVLTVDFHPIHIFLNSRTNDDYEATRPHFRDFARLRTMQRAVGSGGTRDRLMALLDQVKRKSVRSVHMSELSPVQE
jgi:hypothetical protein